MELLDFKILKNKIGDYSIDIEPEVLFKSGQSENIDGNFKQGDDDVIRIIFGEGSSEELVIIKHFHKNLYSYFLVNAEKATYFIGFPEMFELLPVRVQETIIYHLDILEKLNG